MSVRRSASGTFLSIDELASGLLEAAPDAIVVTNQDGRIVLVNKRCEELFGYKRTELLGQGVGLLIPMEKREMHSEHVTAYAEAPTTRRMGRGLHLDALHKDGSLVAVDVSLSPALLGDDRLVISIIRDVRERRALEKELEFIGTHDGLTGLYNRRFFDAERERLMRGRAPVGVLAVDVDGLKPVNDALGHEAGDALLIATAALLRQVLRGEDIVARVGGDEFLALLPGASESETESALRRLERRLEAYNIDAKEPKLSFSAGAANCTHPIKLPQAIAEADRRMYEAKRRRKGMAPR